MDPDPDRQRLAALLPDTPAKPGEALPGDEFTDIDDVAALPAHTILRDRHGAAWQVAEGATCDSAVPYMQRAGSHIAYPLHPDYQAKVYPAWERLVPLTMLWAPAPPTAQEV